MTIINNDTRIQLRGQCCVCGKFHALRNNNLVHHGYSVSWGSFSGSCYGTDAPHYGDERAPAFLASYIDQLNQYKQPMTTKLMFLQKQLQREL